MTLEKIVRPFQLFEVSRPTRIKVEETKTADNCVLEFGTDPGKLKTVKGNASATVSIYIDNKTKTKALETSTWRVKNPDDDSQYVDVEVVDKARRKRGAGLDYQKDLQKFVTPPKAKENAEIIERTTYSDSDNEED